MTLTLYYWLLLVIHSPRTNIAFHKREYVLGMVHLAKTTVSSTDVPRNESSNHFGENWEYISDCLEGELEWLSI